MIVFIKPGILGLEVTSETTPCMTLFCCPRKNEHQSLYRHHSVENPLSGKKSHSTLSRSDSKEIRSAPYFESDLSLSLLCICSYFTIWSHKDKSESSKES